MMYQLVILIPHDVNSSVLDDGWPDFLREAESMPGLLTEAVCRLDRTIFGQNPISRIYTFSFADRQSFENALLSSPGRNAGRILHQITGGQAVLLGMEYQQDSLDHIQSRASENETA